jgi:hypothetical protein
MKKIIFLFIFIIMGQFVFSQSEIMQFFSMGFNTENDSRGNGPSYHFYGYDDYSEAFIYGSSIQLSTGEPRTFYPNGLITYLFPPNVYYPYDGQNNSVGYYSTVPSVGAVGGVEHKFENGRLVYWALTYDFQPFTTLERIEQNSQGITIYYKESGENFQCKYYNIPRMELLDLYLKKYVWIICATNEMVNEYDNVNVIYDSIIPLLQGRTPRELAILRNCLYAVKGYRFANSTWTDFFNKYLDGYRGRFSNDEVTAMFTKNEKWLLDLVIQHENRR